MECDQNEITASALSESKLKLSKTVVVVERNEFQNILHLFSLCFLNLKNIKIESFKTEVEIRVF
jgi:hypothetical protein